MTTPANEWLSRGRDKEVRAEASSEAKNPFRLLAVRLIDDSIDCLLRQQPVDHVGSSRAFLLNADNALSLWLTAGSLPAGWLDFCKELVFLADYKSFDYGQYKALKKTITKDAQRQQRIAEGNAPKMGRPRIY